MEKFIGIIPARYQSSRFPGKPLALIGKKTMIQRVYEQAIQAIESVYVATDDERIQTAVESFGGKAIMTDTNLSNGTVRCLQAIEKLSSYATVIINIQGDEPFINPKQIKALIKLFDNQSVNIATQIKPITDSHDLFNPNIPKVVVNKKMEAIYFSRSPIPYLRNYPQDKWLSNHQFFKHIGLYAYRYDTLKKIAILPPTPNELAESLEQLRWIDHGYTIQTGITEYETIGIDTPEDLQKIPKEWL